MNKMTKNSIALALITLAGVVFGGAVILEALGKSATGLYSFALAIVPVLVVQLYAGQKNAEATEQIKSAVNGNLTAQLDGIKEHTMQTVAAATRTNVDDLRAATNVTIPNANPPSDPGGTP